MSISSLSDYQIKARMKGSFHPGLGLLIYKIYWMIFDGHYGYLIAVRVFHIILVNIDNGFGGGYLASMINHPGDKK